jgi:hypothetical protein
MAITADSLVITAAEYKCVMILPNNVSVILTTLQGIDMNGKRESEPIHAIGQQDPIAQKRNNASYSGKLDIQLGEWTKVLTLAGIIEGTQIENATLAITSVNPNGIQRVYNGLNIDGEGISIKAKDKQTVVSLDWNALNVSGIAA